MSLPADPISSGLEAAKIIVISVIILVLAVFGGYEAYTKSLLQTEVSEQNGAIDQYKAEDIDWQTKEKQWNEAVQKLKDDSAAREAAAVKAVADARAEANAYNQVAVSIMNSKTPVIAGAADPDCAASKQLLNNYFRVKP